MEIRTATKSDINSIYEFNSRIYPEKIINCKEYINFWLSKSPEAINYFLLLIDEQGKIAGQSIMSPMDYFFHNIKHHAAWGFDLIVDEQYRKDTWGIDLMISNKEYFPNLFGTGSNPLSLKIDLKLGMKQLGEIKKYVGVINPLWMFNALLGKKITSNSFPSEIEVKDNCFVLINKFQLPSLSNPFNDNLLEISRDNDFMQWRFFNKLHDYAIYKEKNSNNYFVLRTTIIKHVTIMLLVDYRCNAQIPEQFENILQAAKHITSKLHLPILITGSTLKAFDGVLEQHHFKSIGRPRPVVGYIKCKDRKKDIENRNFIFITLADSDGETNWI